MNTSEVQTASQSMPIILSLVAAFAGAFAQYFYKIGADSLLEIPIYKNGYIFAGLASFTAVLILFLAAFRMGGRLFVIYPVYATTFIWSGLIAHYLIHEPIQTSQWLGVGFIVIGVTTISIFAN